jgi:transposase
MEPQDARSLAPAAQEAVRVKAVQAVLAGRSQREVGELFGVSRQIVNQWFAVYRRKGRAGLKARRRGRPRGGRLAGWQAAQTVRTLTDRTPEQLKLPWFLWTREAVRQLLAQRYGVKVSIWTVGRYLAQWNFTPQKPLRRAYEQNPAEVKCWLEEEYPGIRARAKREGAEIFWIDEMGMRSDHATGRTYGRRGRTPAIPGTGQRFRCNQISAITNRGRLNFMIFRQDFEATVFLAFLRRLLRQIPRKVFIIVDRHPVHRSKKVCRWMDRHPDRIAYFYLPGYSPELNPDELLNHDVKSNAVGRRRPHSCLEMVSHVRRFLRSRLRQPGIIRNYFREPHVAYAAA